MRILFLIMVLIITTVNAQNRTEPETVDKVDLKRYTGLWYEIAKIPNRFQSDCVRGTTAEYRINEYGEIEVTNSCIEADGNKNVADGIAKVVDKKTNSKLEVSFFSILGIRPFWGDYWIIGLDKDYGYAIVGSPDRKYGWILSRTPEMSDKDLSEAYDILTGQGYDKSRFVKSVQK